MELKNVDFDESLVECYKKEQKWKELAYYLKERFKLQRNESGKPIGFNFSEAIIIELQNLLCTILQHKQWDDNLCKVLVETIRALRNYIINEDAQNYLVNEEFFGIIDKLLKQFTTLETTNTNVALSNRYLLQLLLNMLTSNPKTVLKVYNMFYAKLSDFFVLEEKYVYEMSALIYNLTRQKPLIKKEVIEKIIDLYEGNEHSNEFLHFLIEKIIREDYFWEHYNDFSTKQQILVLEFFKEQLLHKRAKLSSTGLECVVKMFLMSANVIFQVEQSECTLTAYKASNIVEILSMLSSNEDTLKLLQTNKDILINAGVLLINVHRLGKNENNCFTPIQKLSDVQDSQDELKEHVAFGFKAYLVRLIGNLCWKNKQMQDLARVAEIIPVLLDCCNMDAKNPFIIQWGILAIRNLCENNPENQKVIAGLHQEGTVSSGVLEEMGITLHSDGDSSLKIVPLDSLGIKK